MIIETKFSSVCPTCGGNITPGTKINYIKGQKATHAVCSVAPSASSARPPAAPRKAWKEPTPVEAPVQVIEHRGWSRPMDDDRVGDLLRTSSRRRPENHPNTVVVVIAQRRSYLSRDDAEDLATPADAGWTVTLYCRLADDAERAAFEAQENSDSALKEAKKQQQQEARAAKDAKERAIVAAFEEATVGMVYAGEGIPMPALYGDRQTFGVIEGVYRTTFSLRCTQDAKTIAVKEAHSSDDHRVSWWGPEDVVVAAFQYWAETYKITQAAAREWLEKNKGCSGEEAYVWRAAQP